MGLIFPFRAGLGTLPVKMRQLLSGQVVGGSQSQSSNRSLDNVI